MFIAVDAISALPKFMGLTHDIDKGEKHGKGVLEYTFLRSTAQTVLRRAKKPFFIVPLPSCDTDNAYNI